MRAGTIRQLSLRVAGAAERTRGDEPVEPEGYSNVTAVYVLKNVHYEERSTARLQSKHISFASRRDSQNDGITIPRSRKGTGFSLRDANILCFSGKGNLVSVLD